MTAPDCSALMMCATSVATQTFPHAVSCAATATSLHCTTLWGGEMTITGHKHQHDYKPGWTYLTGQRPCRKVIEARMAEDQAWLEYGYAVDAESPHMHTLLDKAVKLQEEAERLSREWNRNYKD